MYFTHFREPFEYSLLNSVYLYTLFNNKETLKNCFAVRVSGYDDYSLQNKPIGLQFLEVRNHFFTEKIDSLSAFGQSLLLLIPADILSE